MPAPKRLLVALIALAGVAHAAPAAAHWTADGSGAGSAPAATMPGGQQPSVAVAARDVTVTWPQAAFGEAPLGSYPAGGYAVARYPGAGGGSTPAEAACAGTVGGHTPELACVETSVPYGTWRYAVTPRLGSFTGAESPRSVTVTVAPAAPASVTVTPRDPAAGQSTGDIEIEWEAVPGAAGYNVYRRAAPAPYDMAHPVNRATPVGAGTTFTDPGAGLTGGTTYHYLVRAVAGSPAVESASSAEEQGAAVARPAAPGGPVAALAAPAGRIDVSWDGVPGAAGYNVYRRTDAGAYDFTAPANGTPLQGTSWTDMAATDAATYRYVVRAVGAGAGTAWIESADSAESPAATADAVAPPAPLTPAVLGGGSVAAANVPCGAVPGTRYINAAGQGAVPVSAGLASPEPGETVVISAAAPGGAAVTTVVPATGATVSAVLHLGTLPDGAVAVTARARDAAGNESAPAAPSNAIVKDTAAPPLSASYQPPFLLGSPDIAGASECGATIDAVQAQGPRPGAAYSSQITSGTAFALTVEGPALLGTVRYDVRATDLAGNVSAPVRVGS